MELRYPDTALFFFQGVLVLRLRLRCCRWFVQCFCVAALVGDEFGEVSSYDNLCVRSWVRLVCFDSYFRPRWVWDAICRGQAGGVCEI